jgi:PRTRC genetic system protein E
MLITSLLPLLSRYSLGFDLVVGANDMVTLTIIPRKAEGAKHTPDAAEIRPISISAPAHEIDAELAKGEAGALGQLIAARKTLADQLAEQREAAEAAKTSAAAKAKPKAPAPAIAAKAEPTPATAPKTKPGEPASLW